MSKTTPTVAKVTGKSLEEFRSSHDKSFIVPKKIREGLDKLGESWEYEQEFIKRCSLSTTDFATYRSQFEAYIVDTKGRNNKRVVAGSRAFASKLREKIQ